MATKRDMTSDVQMDIDDRSAQAVLTKLETLLSPPAVGVFLDQAVDPYLRSRLRDRFFDEGDEVVGRWAALKPATVQIRQQAGFGPAHPINRRTGELEEYLTTSPSRVNVHSLGATLVLPGSPPTGEVKKKLKTAQVGKSNPPTSPRPVLGVGMADLAFVQTSLMTYIQTGGQIS